MAVIDTKIWLGYVNYSTNNPDATQPFGSANSDKINTQVVESGDVITFTESDGDVFIYTISTGKYAFVPKTSGTDPTDPTDPTIPVPTDPTQGWGALPEAEKAFIQDLIDKGTINAADLVGCLIAKGADGKYHVYKQNGTNKERYDSLARLYGTKESGKTLKGVDLVPEGSGILYGDKKAANKAKVYTIKTAENKEETAADGTKTKKLSMTTEESEKMYHTASPLSFDLNGDGVRTSEEMIQYDIDGDGILDNINDSADGILCFDKDKDGAVGEDGSECFGNNTDLDGDGVADGYTDGFAALKALALRAGLINNADDMVLDTEDIKTLERDWGLAMKTNGYNGEAKSLVDLGITQINFGASNETQSQENFDGQHNDLMTQEGATFQIGDEIMDYADIWHAMKEDFDMDEDIKKDFEKSIAKDLEATIVRTLKRELAEV